MEAIREAAPTPQEGIAAVERTIKNVSNASVHGDGIVVHGRVMIALARPQVIASVGRAKDFLQSAKFPQGLHTKVPRLASNCSIIYS